jgi:ABC-type lipoprotein export system ATPase subunit
MAPLVEARELFAVYPSPTGGVAALQGLTLEVEEQSVCVLLGPSGSGKTTFMRVLAGLERPSAGSIVVGGTDLAHASASRLGHYRSHVLGYADQHYWLALASELTAEQLVALPLGLGGASARDRSARARELLERVGLLDRAEARPAELSGGEQQRIALCAAVAHRPQLVIADEPTGELDAETSAEVYALLAELVTENGTTAIVVSHDPSSAEIADQVAHIRDGRLSAERHGGEETTVVGAGGWLRVPEDVLHAAGIGDRATILSGPGVVELHPVDGRAHQVEAMSQRAQGSAGSTLEAVAVSRRYGEQAALVGVDARFDPGELAVITGPSGSGKSTLLAILAGLDLPDEGEIRLGEVVVSSLGRDERAALRADRIGVLGQIPGLSDWLTSRENVVLGLALRGVDRDIADERASEALATVGLVEHADRRVGVLSAGQRERVALARVVAARPSVVVADEPTARLDAATTVSIGALLAELAHSTGTTVVCATHDPLLIGLADREVRLRAPVPVASR